MESSAYDFMLAHTTRVSRINDWRPSQSQAIVSSLDYGAALNVQHIVLNTLLTHKHNSHINHTHTYVLTAHIGWNTMNIAETHQHKKEKKRKIIRAKRARRSMSTTRSRRATKRSHGRSAVNLIILYTKSTNTITIMIIIVIATEQQPALWSDAIVIIRWWWMALCDRTSNYSM